MKRPKLTWRERITLVLLTRWVGERWREAMMIVKPEGLLPSARRRLELHEAEMDDAPVAAPGGVEA